MFAPKISEIFSAKYLRGYKSDKQLRTDVAEHLSQHLHVQQSQVTQAILTDNLQALYNAHVRGVSRQHEGTLTKSNTMPAERFYNIFKREAARLECIGTPEHSKSNRSAYITARTVEHLNAGGKLC